MLKWTQFAELQRACLRQQRGRVGRGLAVTILPFALAE